MKLNITATDFDVTPAIKNHITEKFDHLHSHYQNIGDVHVILRIEKAIQQAEANLHLDHTNFNATAQDRDLYTAIDNCIAKLDTQLSKHKQRLQDKRT